jgi:hypothetical protein
MLHIGSSIWKNYFGGGIIEFVTVYGRSPAPIASPDSCVTEQNLNG